jgi:hypothetical protein
MFKMLFLCVSSGAKMFHLKLLKVFNYNRQYKRLVIVKNSPTMNQDPVIAGLYV